MLEALAAEPAIRVVTGTRVTGVLPPDRSGRMRLDAEPRLDEPFDWVVNALWEGRIAVDRSVGLTPEPGWSHRYRLSLFVRSRRPLVLPSFVLATGPFGDVKNYDGGNFYLSWYPAGLVVEGHRLEPPEVPDLPSAGALTEATRRGLCECVPGAERIFESAASIKVGGGWVFANGRGSLADPGATLHRRDAFGILRVGRYLSVDTGKFSTAPWLAQRVAHAILS
jgi:hypothetical protein